VSRLDFIILKGNYSLQIYTRFGLQIKINIIEDVEELGHLMA
jgi:hypothetical protein